MVIAVALEDREETWSIEWRPETGNRSARALLPGSKLRYNRLRICMQPSTTFVSVAAATIQTNMAFNRRGVNLRAGYLVARYTGTHV